MAVSNRLAPHNTEVVEKKPTFSTFMNQADTLAMVKNAVGENGVQHFTTSIISAVSINPDLAKCTYPSIISSALVGNALHLSPTPACGQFFMVPFKNNKLSKLYKKDIYEAQFVLGYKGYLQLAYRTGAYKVINVVPIKQGEFVSWDPIEEKLIYNLIEDDVEREEAETVGYYAYYEYLAGTRKAMYWSKRKMMKHADKYSPAFSMNATHGKYPKVSFADYEAGKYKKEDEWLYSSYWYKNFDDMGCKTLLRQLISKWGIMSIELEKAFMYDGAVIDENQQPHFLDNTDFMPETAQDSDPVVAEVTVVEQEEKVEPITVEPAMVDPVDNQQEDIESLFFGEV